MALFQLLDSWYFALNCDPALKRKNPYLRTFHWQRFTRFSKRKNGELRNIPFVQAEAWLKKLVENGCLHLP